VGNKEWVLCDGCEKWRKIPKGFKFDRSKNFFCNMIPKLTCDAKEESWEQNENDCRFIDADWVLASWDRMKRELFKEKNKIDSAARIALKAKTNAGACMVGEQLPHEERGGGPPPAVGAMLASLYLPRVPCIQLQHLHSKR